MSKKISKKITHEEARSILNNVFCEFEYDRQYKVLTEYVKEQEIQQKENAHLINECEVLTNRMNKQSKLLELFRSVLNELIRFEPTIENQWEGDIDVILVGEPKNKVIVELLKEIKELDNENKSTKKK